MRWTLLFLALPLLLGCQPLDPVSGWDPRGVNCAQNTAPKIRNVQVNSAYIDEAQAWVLVVGFNWADPGTGGASDPPNLLGGEFAIEVSGLTSEDILLTESVLESGCVSYGGDGSPTDYCDMLTVGGGCPSGGVAGCGTASLTIPGLIIPGSSEVIILEGDVLTMEMRVRDLCGLASNSKSATYTLGQGLIIENEDS